MKRSYLYTLLFCTVFMGGCIDEYEANLPSSDEKRLVVEGNIRSDMLCTFYLTYSLGLKESATYFGLFPVVTDARLSVIGEDGTVFPDSNNGLYLPSGAYQVEVGTLRPDVRYWLRIETDGDVFTSDPQFPVNTESELSLSFNQERSDQEVDILVTSAAPGDGQRKYYRWDYTEYWEINTPYKAEFEYDPASDKIVKAETLKNHGWCTSSSASAKMVSSSDFQENRIVGMPIISITNFDNRLNSKYIVRVYQRCISQEEYEYEMLRNKLTNQMGGLFTPMPADLPTNIHCESGDRKAIGFVGVSGQVATATLAISSSQVNYKLGRSPRQIDHKDLTPASCRQIYYSGYRLFRFNYDSPGFQGNGPFDADSVPDKKWAERWCVDCTDPYWNASLRKPSDWPE
ncbi:MAG: DUF4249 domain-containing protein [Bacteroidaceae bacterium]|nr:DUF4249 domain-containing protein [Bacteroidaceae bacterium]